MSVASHLAVAPAQCDERIRGLSPLCDELIPQVARALAHAARPVRLIRPLQRAGFVVDVPWRRSPFAVIVVAARLEDESQ